MWLGEILSLLRLDKRQIMFIFMLLLASSFSIFVKDIHDISYSHLVFFPLVIDTCLELSAFEMNEQNELLFTRTFLLPYVATHDSFGRLEKLLLDFIRAKMYCEYVWIIMSFSFQTYMYQKWLKLCTHTHNIWVSWIWFYRKWQPFAHGNQRRRPSYIRGADSSIRDEILRQIV